MKNYKTKISTKIQIILSLVVLMILTIIQGISVYGSENPEINQVGYLEENQAIELPITDEQNFSTISNSYSNLENPKIEVEESKSLLNYQSTEDPIEYTKQNQEEMVQGIELKIKDSTIYVEKEELLGEAKDNVARILLDNIEYESYLQTDKINNVEIANREISEIKIEDDLIKTTTYVSKDKLITSSNDLIFALFHKNSLVPNYKKETYEVKENETFEEVLEKNDLKKYEFFLNNPQYKSEPLLNIGDEIIVNKVDPLVDVAVYYEEQEEEVEEFNTIRKEDDSMAYGEEELVQEGKDGSSLVTYKKKSVNGKEVQKEIILKEEIEQPVNRVIYVGTDESQGSVSGNTTPSDSSNSGGLIWPSDSRSTSRGLSVGHNGTDITSYYGSPVYASQSGVVATSGWNGYGGGYEVTINHGGGLYTIYSHMAQPPNVSVGQSVYQGQVVGYMGASGNVTGTHLHWEVRVGCSSGAFSGTPVEPYGYL